ncbi:hypothetical protein B0T19DRAFT_458565 [Cercophora scortea]|uniref:Uncharacterized protein n=1 Tax=Cercophora scortea TaxID=314031 RepID=A0AAE0IXX6_9PEZI|nr:hypothetical protein B0T19DRAFT_458565 [Cercophora scortea]
MPNHTITITTQSPSSSSSSGSARTSTRSGSVLPSYEIRAQIGARLRALADAIHSHRDLKAPRRYPTLYYLWDFVMRTRYILSEVENVELGLAVRYPNEIPGYRVTGKPCPKVAKQFMRDIYTRSHTLDLLITAPPMQQAAIGLVPVDLGGEIKARSKAVMEAFCPIRGGEFTNA